MKVPIGVQQLFALASVAAGIRIHNIEDNSVYFDRRSTFQTDVTKFREAIKLSTGLECAITLWPEPEIRYQRISCEFDDAERFFILTIMVPVVEPVCYISEASLHHMKTSNNGAVVYPTVDEMPEKYHALYKAE